MADIINLRQARKAKARKDKDVQAVENRARFGRTKAERRLDEKQKEDAARHLDAHKTEEP